MKTAIHSMLEGGEQTVKYYLFLLLFSGLSKVKYMWPQSLDRGKKTVKSYLCLLIFLQVQGRMCVVSDQRNKESNELPEAHQSNTQRGGLSSLVTFNV